MGVNFLKKYQNLVISKFGKNQNKTEVAEEISSQCRKKFVAKMK